MAGCDLVFVDPDNGLRRDDHRIPSHRSSSVKHAYHHELRVLAYGGRRSVVAYHHADRSATVPEQARQRLAEAAVGVGLAPLATVIARRGTPRLFLVLAAPAHQLHLEQRLHSIADGKWGNDLKVAWSRRPDCRAPLQPAQVSSERAGTFGSILRRLVVDIQPPSRVGASTRLLTQSTAHTISWG